ncbi:hypothetical protein HO173_002349 [Letharia columbiana]|uniref:Hydrophobin n=1 Tax=Letharia columbiana TaxID=112416 RepID=A0A8H6G3D0_9LECA|nr:uncharacterized protein HO173_002349 [Letharia columbiana]KAF6239803.1 hypothetical protein HO173_002349 [Letharia columbiana]
MHFTATAILAFTLLTTTSLTTAIPTSTSTGNAKRQAPLPCSGASATPNCCAVNVLSLADLQCADPPTLPTDVANFTQICADVGQEAQCCTLDLVSSCLSYVAAVGSGSVVLCAAGMMMMMMMMKAVPYWSPSGDEDGKSWSMGNREWENAYGNERV